jgi:hypothetical protein
MERTSETLQEDDIMDYKEYEKYMIVILSEIKNRPKA